jgi:hypothetical protein
MSSKKLRKSMTMWVWWTAEIGRPLPRRPREGRWALNARNSSMWVRASSARADPGCVGEPGREPGPIPRPGGHRFRSQHGVDGAQVVRDHLTQPWLRHTGRALRRGA